LRRRCGGRVARRAGAAAGKAEFMWDEGDVDEDDFLGIGMAQADAKTKRIGGILDNFSEGANLKQAKLFAMTRTFAVAPWNEDVKSKPIFAVSDSTGNVAKRLAVAAFSQFGCADVANVTVVPDIRTEAAVREVVREAALMAPKKALAIDKSGGMLVYTIASQALGALLADECNKQGVPCINALEPVLLMFEKRFKRQRNIEALSDAELAGVEKPEAGFTVFAVSDSSGGSAHAMAIAALKQFPGNGVESITNCSEVRSLEEINCIVQESRRLQCMLIFTFASPGMSRYTRMQCERAKVLYVDVYQPVIIAFENYLNYPPVGVAGGHQLKDDADAQHFRWQSTPVPK